LILKETGCYADFTLPTAPSETQTRTINRIYYATDDPGRPKSHDRGVEAEVNGSPSGDLMIIQGPLTLDWVRRKWGLFPRIESGEIKGDNPPSEHRADLWLKPRIHVKGNPNWVFIKVYTHGTQERNAQVLFGRPMDSLFSYMENRYNDGRRYRLHYVTAREMFNIIKAAEEGLRGDPQQYRNHVLCPLVKSERAHRVSSSLGGHPAGKDRTGG
jgi:hypothetical protein